MFGTEHALLLAAMRYNKIQNQYQRSDISAAIRRCGFVANFLQRRVNFCVRQRVQAPRNNPTPKKKVSPF
jgi:hypothetical protein